MSDVYFGSRPTIEISKYLLEKVQDYHNYLSNSGMLEQLRKSYKTFKGDSYIDNLQSGLKAYQTNHYANLIRHISIMTTSQRPAFQARAINSDFESQSKTILANGLLDYYIREKGLEDLFRNAVEQSLYLRESFLKVDWSPEKGEIVGIDPESTQPIKEGDLSFKLLTILEVVRDVNNYGKQEWYITVEKKNKFDLAKQYPELESRITSISSSNSKFKNYEATLNPTYIKQPNSDLINVYTFIHDKTTVLENGRMVVFLEDETVLFDGGLPYQKPYIFKITPSQLPESSFGSSPAMDLLPLQTALDSCYSTILTNMSAFGVQNIVSEKGAGLTVNQIGEGLNLIEIQKGFQPPQPLQLLQTSPEVYNFANSLIQNMENISGVNSVARGNAPASLSGAALALIQQQALSFNAGVQASYNQLLENVGTAIIELLQTFAYSPRIATIVGKNNKSYIKEFSNQDLMGINKVVVDSANALTKTQAGKVEIANNLLQTGLIKTPEQYIQVLTTGTIDPILESNQSQNLLIKDENEWLLEGKTVIAIMTDNHSEHVINHATVLNSPEARLQPQVIQNVLNHIQEHINLSKTQDPILAAMLKQQSFMQPPQGQVNPETMDIQNPITQQAEAVNLPQPAQSPL